MSAPLKFAGAYSTTGEMTGLIGTAERLHPLYPTQVVGSNGYMLILNGFNLNRRTTDVVGYDGDVANIPFPLQMLAPPDELTPLLTYAGNGSVFGLGYKWRYRWKNSRTGEYSGLSPNPSASWNLGVETFPGSNIFLGQTAYFRIPVSSRPAGTDTLQLFRNSSAEESIWYLVSEKTTDSVSYVDITDDISDDTLFNAAEVVSLANSSGPTFDEGIMPPVAKAYAHPTARTAYFGLRRYKGLIRRYSTTGTVAVGDRFIEIEQGVEAGRVGQRLRLGVPGQTIDDPTVYRITAIVTAGSYYNVYVYPPIASSAYLTGVGGTVAFYIEDDREGRAVWFSEPGQPWLIDPYKTLYIGQDYSDEALHMFSMNGVTHVQTRQAIYRLENDQTEDPSLSAIVSLASDEGSVGLEAGCDTPFGWVYMHHGLGIRVFDGQKSMPVGGEDEYTVFIANTQFQGIETNAIGECKLAWDHDKKVLLLSYVPTGKTNHCECLAFDPMTRTWRGPWRQRLFSSGSIRTLNGDEVFVAGDDFGNLYKNDEQVLDMVNPAAVLTGAVAASHVIGSTVITVDAFDTTNYMRGCPIWFYNPATGIYYYSVIAYVNNSTTITLQFPPVDENGNLVGPTSAYTWAVGSIRWSMMTSYIDAGEPVLPKKIEHLSLRFRRGSAGGDFLVDVALDGDTTNFLGEKLTASSSPAITVSPTNTIFKKVRLSREGRAFTLRLRGQSTSGHPQITGAMTDLEVRGGA